MHHALPPCFKSAATSQRPGATACATTTRLRQAGISLIEAMVTLAVVSITVGTAVPSLINLGDRQRLQSLVAQVETDLFHARSLAVERNQVLRLSIDKHSAPGCYVLHTGTQAGQCRCDPAQPTQTICSGSAQALRVVQLHPEQRLQLTANVSAMAFEPSRGTVTPAGTLRVTSASGDRVNLVVNIMGRARTCTPNGAAGWAAC